MMSSLSSSALSEESASLVMPGSGAIAEGTGASSYHLWVWGADAQSQGVIASLLEECQRVSAGSSIFQLHFVEEIADIATPTSRDVCLLWSVAERQASEVLANSHALPPVIVVLGEVGKEGIEEAETSVIGVKGKLLKLGASDCLTWDELLAPALERSLRLAVAEIANRFPKADRQHRVGDQDTTIVAKVPADLERSRRILEKAQSLAGVGSFDWDVVSGKVEWSDTMFRIFGYEPKSISPSIELIFEHIHPHDRELMQSAIAQPRKRHSESMLFCIRRADGEERFLQGNSDVEVDEEGKAVRFIGSAQDVTEQLLAQQALRDSEERYALAARGANDGLWDWNLRTNLLYLSPRWLEMIGCLACAEEGNPEEWLGRVHPDDRPVLEATLERHLSGVSAHFECEYRLMLENGGWKWMLGRGLAVRDRDGVATRIAGSQTDISDRKDVESQLAHSAFYDSLTGLPNRALFLERLERAIARAARDAEHSFAVLFLDLDRFKNINDSLGHLAGDALLVEAGHRFASCLRPGDTVARLGGDEFAVLLEGLADEEVVEGIANRVQGELEKPFVLEGHEVFITVSIGVAPASGDQVRAVDLLRNADTAMYRAKGLGRARHATFDASMYQRAVRMLELESDLWRALERDELRLHFQPLVDLSVGQIYGFEALVRWQHPERGMVSPGEFIPIAEETGLIVPIGWWVLEEACRQAMQWSSTFVMAVNLSSQQLAQSDCIERVRAALEKTGFDARRLKIEITETVIMQNTEAASATLQALKAMGITLAMDDFGTGYSSLSYLHRFPLDTLKIDRSFVAQMSANSKNDPLVNTILDLARSLKMRVVAEGVESEEQLRLLRDMGCHLAQGFFFARPLPPAQIEELLAHAPRW